MNKSLKIFLSLLVLFVTFPINSMAAEVFEVISIYDPNNITSDPYFDSSTNNVKVMVSGDSAVKVYFGNYPDSSYSAPQWEKTVTAEQMGWNNFTGMSFDCNGYYRGVLYDSSDNVLVEVRLNVTGLVDPSCDSSSGGGMGEKTCDSCEILNCPGWNEYMGKVDQIIGKIPPPPNWPEVADTFRDSIVPRLITDLGNLLGTAPDPPQPPDMPSGIDDHGFKNSTPQGQEAPGLGDTDFSRIKDEAPVIEEIPDTSEGFNILNPIDSLPSQEEFLENIPADVDNPTPPPPKDTDVNAPMPPDEDFGSPPIPPQDEGSSVPIPSDSGETAPIPSDSEGTVPIPGSEGWVAPIPKDETGNFPIPNN